MSKLTSLDRRQFAAATLGGLASTAGWLPHGFAAQQAAGNVGLAFGTYGMPTLSFEESLRALAEIGYDGVEPALLPGWPTDPARLSPAQRTRFGRLLRDSGLAVPALLESLKMTGTAAARATNLERLKRAVELGHAWFPEHPPLVETILGGKTAEWEQVKGRMADELRQWAKVAADARTIVCFKPHASDAVQSAERALWLIRAVGSPWIRVVYDYSHFFVEGFALESSLRQLYPYTPFIALKDSEGTPAKHRFLLPGEGKTDYPAYFRLLKELGYAGFLSVEVSGMIHHQPGYQPIATARACYARLAPLLEQAGIRRAAAHTRIGKPSSSEGKKDAG